MESDLVWKLFSGSNPVIAISSKNEFHNAELKYDSSKHKTDKYDDRYCVVRRGTTLHVSYHCYGTHKVHDLDKLSIVLTTRSVGKIKKIQLTNGVKNKYGFCVAITSHEHHKKIVFDISIAAFAPIGHYEAVIYSAEDEITKPTSFLVICNPYHAEDIVYMENDSERKEYVLNDQGAIYFGSVNSYGSSIYDIDQFTLECCMVSMHFLSRLPIKDRMSPIKVSRAFSALVNSNDDSGLVVGNWGEITDGSSPLSWKNSVDIYRKYLEEASPVRYGQCFVFALVLTSTMRCLGIPTRAVTGFTIAHDDNLDGNLTIYLNEKNLDLIRGMSETLWNFHVWCNVWMKRDDISVHENKDAGDHWQFLDGTPQERSQGVYRCGPYPLSLLRRGICEKLINYDGLPIYNSINCKSKYVIIDENKKIIKEIEKDEVGKVMLTKSTKSYRPVDITNEHKRKKDKKPPHLKSKIHIHLEVSDVQLLTEPFKYSIRIDGAPVDSDTVVKVEVDLENEFGKNMLSEHIVSKTHIFQSSSFECMDAVNWVLPDEVRIGSSCQLKCSVYCFDPTSSELKVKHAVTRISDSLKGVIHCSTFAKVNKPIDVSVDLTNLLDKEVQDITLTVHLSSHSRNYKSVVIKSHLANVTQRYTFELVPLSFGFCTIVFGISSSIFTGVLDRKSLMVL